MFQNDRESHTRAGQFRLLRILLLVLGVIVFVVALRPMPQGITDLFDGRDKLEHMVVFLGLALIGAAGWPRRLWAVGAGLLAFGLVIEIAQSFTAGRTASLKDWIADFIGIAAALLVVQFVSWVRNMPAERLAPASGNAPRQRMR